jgi:phosphohistidine phosphatase
MKGENMKKIIIIRHSKAEDQIPGISDFERSLTPRGKAIAHQMAKELSKVDKGPGLFVSSPAFRALETAIIFASDLGVDHDKILINNNIYNRMNMNTLFSILSETGEQYDKILLFGHNPGFTEITNNLCMEGCEFMPKCAIAGISFGVKTWKEIGRNSGIMEFFLKPEK